MYKYGKVIFREGGEKGARLQNTLNSRLSAQGVIVASKETLQKWFEEDKIERVGRVCSYALHDKKEVDIFKTIMGSDEMQDESVQWKVSKFGIDRHDREFRKWLKKTEKENWAEEEYRKTMEPKDKKEKKK